jgi:hypothetical protein
MGLQKNETLREYFVNKNYVIISNALRSHDDNDDFTEIETYVRDVFDWFFFRLGQFHQMIQANIYSYDEIEVHLKYILDLVSGGKEHIAPDLQKAIHVYVKKYDFYDAAAIIEKSKAKREEPTRPNSRTETGVS